MSAPRVPSIVVVRTLVTLTVLLGLNYIVWRWLFSVHWAVWWISVPLVIAETYSLVDSLLFGFTMWRLRKRPAPPVPDPELTVDVFITTYNEPLELIMETARAAKAIHHPHTTWILDDGNRAEVREAAAAEGGIGVVARSRDWVDRPRHAKAGNLNNALMSTSGEFVLILDADQIPHPDILDRTLGYFVDERMAMVQTPQVFVNVPESDPLGSQAPLFYGPIQQGQDGWNAAFFCGSNAVLRREALMQLGVTRYVSELEQRIRTTLGTAARVIAAARVKLPPEQSRLAVALVRVRQAVEDAEAALERGEPFADITREFQRRVGAASQRLVESDARDLRADMAALDELSDGVAELDRPTLERLARRDWSPAGAIETVRTMIAVLDVDREDEAQPIMPMSTISVTEDMATCMRLHGLGWRTAYHDETLALGIAPEDLGTMLTQRLRWAQGTIQVMLRENPFAQKGLTFPQRLMYGATMWSYFSGFAALVYIAAPVIYLLFGVLPVQALSTDFFVRLIPFLLVNQLLFFVIGRGKRTWRGQRYSLALFPVWIGAVTSAVGNVVLGRSLTFAVTPKTRQDTGKAPWGLVRPQLIAMGLLVLAAGIGLLRLALGQAALLGTSINIVWVAFDLALFSIIPRAVLYRGYRPVDEAATPAASSAANPPSPGTDDVSDSLTTTLQEERQ